MPILHSSPIKVFAVDDRFCIMRGFCPVMELFHCVVLLGLYIRTGTGTATPRFTSTIKPSRYEEHIHIKILRGSPMHINAAQLKGRLR